MTAVLPGCYSSQVRNKLCLLAVRFAALLACGSLHAAALIVTNSGDSGEGSLRAAIAEAAPGDSIEFAIPEDDAGYDSENDVFTITLTTGEIVIDKDLTIAGPAAANIAISGNDGSRIFHVASGDVDISNLSFINGRMQGADADPAGPSRGFQVPAVPFLTRERSPVPVARFATTTRSAGVERLMT
jgi:hypothetical protein